MFLEESNKPTVVIAMEVLDNLPHDKVTLCQETGKILQAEIHPIYKNSNESHTELEEKFVPISDELLKEVIALQPSYLPSSSSSFGTNWVPTVACGVLEQIFNARPNTSVVLADFDWLPSPQLESGSTRTRRSLKGNNEPLVTCMNDLDHLCYLDAPPFCDILFPTDFPKLLCFTQNLLMKKNIECKGHIMKQNEFLFQYGPNEIDKTRGRLTGFTPLLEDFTNCSIMSASTRK